MRLHSSLRVRRVAFWDYGNLIAKVQCGIHRVLVIWSSDIWSFRLYGQFLAGPERNWLSYNRIFRLYGLDFGYMVNLRPLWELQNEPCWSKIHQELAEILARTWMHTRKDPTSWLMHSKLRFWYCHCLLMAYGSWNFGYMVKIDHISEISASVIWSFRLYGQF